MTTKSSKYKKYRMSKYQYPTKYIHGADITKGKDTARRALERQLGRELKLVREYDTKSQWIFCEEK